MLVLTRKSEEKIVIGKGRNKVTITILKIQGDKVSIGIEADKETPIYRNELLLKEVEKNNQRDAVDKQGISVKEMAKCLQEEIRQCSSQAESPVQAGQET